MNAKNLLTIAGGVALGVLLAWWLGLFGHPAASAPEPVAAPNVAAAGATSTIASVSTPKPHTTVAAPVLPPVPASQAAPPTPRPASAQVASQDAVFAKVHQQSQVKAATNNLRQLATAASQYMLDKGVTSVSYYDLVGFGTDNYIRSVNPVAGEDYSGFFISQSDTQVSISAEAFGTVTYNM